MQRHTFTQQITRGFMIALIERNLAQNHGNVGYRFGIFNHLCKHERLG